MEAAQGAKMGEFSRYGSTTYKQVYIYGGLDRSPTTLNRSFGMWGLGGWLLTPFLQKIGVVQPMPCVSVLRMKLQPRLQRLHREISLAQMLEQHDLCRPLARSISWCLALKVVILKAHLILECAPAASSKPSQSLKRQHYARRDGGWSSHPALCAGKSVGD